MSDIVDCNKIVIINSNTNCMAIVRQNIRNKNSVHDNSGLNFLEIDCFNF